METKKLKRYDPATERTITTVVPVETARALKKKAIDNDTTIREVVKEVLIKEFPPKSVEA
jgi:hypothetical protein